ncbi:response regulator receiver domain [Acidobacterium sp. S8]|uniref:response regulator receiver domain n=1 Tax=Acidobacterium sp. S8 TaxID=1641854 RepID=UPI00131DE879|nr:response regulator receiver domain [Acidobacterium sp. S8]
MATNPYAYSHEQVRAAFIDPLRSAMLIDDRFPPYAELLIEATLPGNEAKQRDVGEVQALLNQCRQRGLMCDIENRYQDAGKPLSHIETSDLLVLDYHLVSGDDTDSGPALTILGNLAKTPYANLVVVYTAAPELEVIKRGIAAYFHGVPPQTSVSDEYLQLSPILASTFTVEDLEGYLLKGYAGISGATKGAFAQEIRASGLTANVTEIVTQSIHDLLRDDFRAPDFEADRNGVRNLLFSRNGSENIWIAYDNVFVVLVKKSQQKDIFSELEAALLAWNPSPLQLLLVHARNYLHRNGFLADWRVIANEIRHNAFFYHFLAGEEPSSKARISQLFRNVFSDALEGVSEYVSSCGAELLGNYTRAGECLPGESAVQMETRRLDLARIAARSQSKVPRSAVLHELNLYLSSSPFVGSHLKTGSIFKSSEAQDERYWVCVTADCSLVPRAPADKKSWEADLYPNVPVIALRLDVERGRTFDESLTNATRGRHLFITLDGERLSLRISTEDARQPRPEIFILENNCIEQPGGTFRACSIHSSKQADEHQPELRRRVFQVVGQLRPSYADRVLTQTGHHTTRIGVDFVSLAFEGEDAAEGDT